MTDEPFDAFAFGRALGRSSKPNLMLGVALHEAMLNGWPFSFLAERRPLMVATRAMEEAPEITAAMKAIMDVDTRPFPEYVTMVFGGGELDYEGNWTEYERFEREVDIVQLIRDVQAAMTRPRTMEEMKSSWDAYDRKLGEAYKLQAAHYGLGEMDHAEFKRLYECTPLPDKHRYGPHATDPYAPGSRRRRR